MNAALPCPTCSGTGTDTHEDRHTGTNRDTCRTCAGTGSVAAATGETPEASFRADSAAHIPAQIAKIPTPDRDDEIKSVWFNALAPFAMAADIIDAKHGRALSGGANIEVKLADLRRARDALHAALARDDGIVGVLDRTTDALAAAHAALPLNAMDERLAAGQALEEAREALRTARSGEATGTEELTVPWQLRETYDAVVLAEEAHKAGKGTAAASADAHHHYRLAAAYWVSSVIEGSTEFADASAPTPPDAGAVEGLVEAFERAIYALSSARAVLPVNAMDERMSAGQAIEDAHYALSTYRATQSQAPVATVLGADYSDALEAACSARRPTPPSAPSQVDDGEEDPGSDRTIPEGTLEERVRHLELYGTFNVDSWIEEIWKRLNGLEGDLRTHQTPSKTIVTGDTPAHEDWCGLRYAVDALKRLVATPGSEHDEAMLVKAGAELGLLTNSGSSQVDDGEERLAEGAARAIAFAEGEDFYKDRKHYLKLGRAAYAALRSHKRSRNPSQVDEGEGTEVEWLAEVLWRSDNPGEGDDGWSNWVAYTEGNTSLRKDVDACRRRARAMLAALRSHKGESVPGDTPAYEDWCGLRYAVDRLRRHTHEQGSAHDAAMLSKAGAELALLTNSGSSRVDEGDEVEVVARALCVSQHEEPDEPWFTAGGKVAAWQQYEDLARTAIAALHPHKGESNAEAFAKLDDDSLDAIMEVCGEGEAFRHYNSGKALMRDWFLNRLRRLWDLPETPAPQDKDGGR